MKTRLALLAAALVIATACNKSAPTTPSPFIPITELFVNTLDPGGSPFYSFTVSQAGWAGVTFASATTTTSGPALQTNLKLGLGIPAGTGCGVSKSIVTSPGLTAQISTSMDPGIYCVSLADTGVLTGTINFVVRIAQTAAAPTAGSTSTTDTFASNLLPGQSATHQLVLSNGGTLTTTLTMTPVPPSIGLGFGVVVGGDCRLTQSSTITGSNTQISLPVDAGSYCVRVFDTGGLTGPITFSAAITHP